MVGLIIAILIGVLILVVMYVSGVVENFDESTILMLTTVSALFRIMIVKSTNAVISILSTLMLIVFLMRGPSSITSVRGLIKGFKIFSKWTLAGGIAGTTFGFTSAIGSIIVFWIITVQFLPMIPLYAPTININIGTAHHPMDNTTKVAIEISEKISNTWRAFGSGTGNPLEGFFDKNPYLYYTIFVHLKDGKSLTLEDVYTNLTSKYDVNYPIYVYCDGVEGVLGEPIQNAVGNAVHLTGSDAHTIDKYGKDCVIKDGSEIKIYYVDSIDGFNVYEKIISMAKPRDCKYITGIGVVHDGIVICVENE